MKFNHRSLLFAFALAVSPIAAHAEDLFNGKDVSNWRKPTGAWMAVKGVAINPANEETFVLTSGEGILVNGQKGKTSNLISKDEFSDIQAHVEFWIPKHSNSGVYVMGRYEIQIYDGPVKYPGQECGGIYGRAVGEKTIEGHSPLVNADTGPGQWQTLDITFRAPRFDSTGKKIAKAKYEKVLLNGKMIHDNVELNGPTRSGIATNEVAAGPIMLQGNHGPVAFRNLRISPLK